MATTAVMAAGATRAAGAHTASAAKPSRFASALQAAGRSQQAPEKQRQSLVEERRRRRCVIGQQRRRASCSHGRRWQPDDVVARRGGGGRVQGARMLAVLASEKGARRRLFIHPEVKVRWTCMNLAGIWQPSHWSRPGHKAKLPLYLPRSVQCSLQSWRPPRWSKVSAGWPRRYPYPSLAM
jgi:hypothetical protein